MSYDELLGILAQFNLVAWVIVAVAGYLVLRLTLTKGWAMIMLGAAFVILRQVWRFVPDYRIMQGSEVILSILIRQSWSNCIVNRDYDANSELLGIKDKNGGGMA